MGQECQPEVLVGYPDAVVSNERGQYAGLATYTSPPFAEIKHYV